MSFNILFSATEKKLALLLTKGLNSLSKAERAELEIPISVATKEELNQALEHLNSSHLEFNESQINSFCLFMGYPRSGHSLIGCLLDAHEEVCLSHELNVFSLLNSVSLSRNEIYQLITQNSKEFALLKNQWGRYNYHVEGQFQGCSTKCRVIGDKKGGATPLFLYKNPQLLNHFQEIIGVPIKFVHVIRNPFDNIATINSQDQPDLKKAILFYHSLCISNQYLINSSGPIKIIQFRHEDFIKDPKDIMSQLINFFGLKASQQYLNDCCAILKKSPNRSRDTINWSNSLKNEVYKIINQYDFLSGYSFDE